MGIAQGTSTTEYSPFAPVTRWQMALFLTRLYTATGRELPPAGTLAFADLDGLSQDAIVAISQLSALGVTAGTTASTYSPDNAVNRQEMASFLARLVRLEPT